MSKSNPPYWAQKFFIWYANPRLQEAILGDLEEQFEDDRSAFGIGKARRRFIWNVIRFCRPGITKSFVNTQKLNYLGMFKHNFIISLRSFKRYKSTFLINLIGLSTGLASFLLILLWIQHERSVDRFNENDDRLYRVMAHFQLPEKKVTWEYTSGRMASSFKEEYPEVVKSTRINNKFFIPKGIVTYGDAAQEVVGQFADPNIFDVLSYELTIGDPATAIRDKKSVIVSEELATKLFLVPELAIGKTISWNSSLFDKSFIINGVFKSPPKTATRQFELMINYENLIEADQWADDWKGGYAETLIELAEGTDVKAFEKKIANHYDEKINNEKFTVFLQKYSDWYLNGAFEDGKMVGGRMANVKLFTYIAFFIVLIAAINFINLSTAQAATKLKEIGVKKAMGSSKSSLVVQFLTESFLMVAISMLFAIGLVYLTLPIFSKIMELDLVFHIQDNLSWILIGALSLGLIAGIYPALYLSSFRPVSIMKGKLPSLAGEAWMRKGLVITQFALSVIFIVGMTVIKSQLSYIQNKPLGYNKENLLTFSGKGSEYIDSNIFINELRQIPGVVNATAMAGEFLWGNDSQSGFTWGGDPSTRNHLFKSPKIGYNTIETLELEVVAGRSFAPAFNDHDERIIINESAVEFMGLENPIGHKLQYGDNLYMEIIGVVKDFQYGSMHQAIEPLIFRFREQGRQYMVRLQPGSELKAVEAIEKSYQQFYPQYSFESSFLDQDYEALYASEQKVGSLSSYFAFLAIIVSSLGLLGLITFTTERRIKEIGIRKVLGCSVSKIVYILSWDFTKMILIAIGISIPFSYYGVNEWLQNFAYHIDISWWYFAIGGLISLTIAWMVIGTKTFGVATSNPVDALKDE